MIFLLADKADLGEFKFVIGAMMLFILLVVGGVLIAGLWESTKDPGDREK